MAAKRKATNGKATNGKRLSVPESAMASLMRTVNESERARFVSAVAEGLADANAGRVRPHAEVAARMKARFSSKRPR
jgi:predicted transcriptional regulator